jgi:hypothetical protein
LFSQPELGFSGISNPGKKGLMSSSGVPLSPSSLSKNTLLPALLQLVWDGQMHGLRKIHGGFKMKQLYQINL